MDRYYTFQSINAGEIEELLMQVKLWINNKTIDDVDNRLESIEKIINQLEYNASTNSIILDGGEYTSF